MHQRQHKPTTKVNNIQANTRAQGAKLQRSSSMHLRPQRASQRETETKAGFVYQIDRCERGELQCIGATTWMNTGNTLRRTQR
jgi:hypothetical protein